MSLFEDGFDFMSAFWNSCQSLVAFCSWSQQRGRELIQKEQGQLESEKKRWSLTSPCNLVSPLILTIRVKELAPQGCSQVKQKAHLLLAHVFRLLPGQRMKRRNADIHLVSCHKMGSRSVFVCLQPLCSLNGCIVKHRTIQEGKDFRVSLVLCCSKPGQH